MFDEPRCALMQQIHCTLARRNLAVSAGGRGGGTVENLDSVDLFTTLSVKGVGIVGKQMPLPLLGLFSCRPCSRGALALSSDRLQKNAVAFCADRHSQHSCCVAPSKVEGSVRPILAFGALRHRYRERLASLLVSRLNEDSRRQTMVRKLQVGALAWARRRPA